MPWHWIMEKAWPCFFSNCEFLSRYFHHSLSWYTLVLPSSTIGRNCWLFYSASTVILSSMVKAIFALAAMTGYFSMIWSPGTVLWDCCVYDRKCYDCYLLSVANYFSSNAVWVCSGLVIVTFFFFCNALLISCPCIFPTWYTRFSHVVRIWYSDTFWP